MKRFDLFRGMAMGLLRISSPVRAGACGRMGLAAAACVANLAGSCYAASPNAGPLAGGNAVTFTNGNFGAITNVVVGGTTATILDSGASWVTVAMPAAGAAGTVDVVVQTSDNGETTLAGAYTYNPAGWIIDSEILTDWSRWGEVAGMPGALRLMDAAVLNGKIYVGGGVNAAIVTNFCSFDGTNWQNEASFPAVRRNVAFAVLNGTLYSMGGNSAAVVSANVYAFNGTSWSSSVSLPAARTRLNAGVLNGKIYAVGGSSSTTLGSGMQTNVYAFDGTNWTEVAGLPMALEGMAVEALNGYLYSIGGATNGVTNVFRFDGTEWTEVAGLPQPRSYMGSAVMDGKIYAVGGLNSWARTNVYAFDGTNWTETAPLPAARRDLAAAELGGHVYAIGGAAGFTATNTVFEYPTTEAVTGVMPSSGSWTGGYSVVITGTNFGSGADVTNVTLCGVAATITNQTDRRVWVRAAPGTAGSGDVVVQSTSYGTTTKTNAFAYMGSGMQVRGTNGAAVASGAAASLANGTKFALLPAGASWTNTFSITNNGNEALDISGFGISDARFEVAGLPATVAAGGSSDFTVRFAPNAAGGFAGVLTISNDSPTAAYAVNLAGSCYAASTNAGPLAGGNAVTFTNGNFGTITNVVVGGTAATILDSGASWVTVAMPTAGAAGTVDVVVQTSDNGDIPLAGAYTYNPAGDIGGTTYDWTQWQSMPGLPQARYYLGGDVLDGKMYVVGGSDAAGTAMTNVYMFDGTSWTEVAGLPRALRETAVATYDGALYSIGGYTGSSRVTNVYKYNGTTWSEVAGLPAPRFEMGAGVLGGHLLAYGGRDSGGALTNVYSFDGSSWAEITGMNPGKFSMGYAACSGKVYSVAGYTFTSATYAFDGSTWSAVSNYPISGGCAALAGATLDGYMYMYGGQDFDAGLTNAFRYDGNAWNEIAGLPTAMSDLGAAAYDGSVYAFGGRNGSTTLTNVYRYPGHITSSGVLPASGSWTGGYEVVIAGTHLCDGSLSDVAGVTLCGVTATVTGVSGSTQIVVTAGAASTGGLGDVTVVSIDYGTTTQSNAFTYNAPGMQVLGTNGAVVASGAAAAVANGTKFAPRPVGAAWTNTLAITNNGTETLIASGHGISDARFEIAGMPAAVAAGGVSNFTVKFTPDAVGSFAGVLTISNDSPTAAYVVNLSGSCFAASTNVGPFGGGNTVTFTNGDFGTITNVLVDGVPAAITDSGSSWVTVTMPPIGTNGTVDITVQTSDNGDAVLANAYTYNPAGRIIDHETVIDRTRWMQVQGLPAGRRYLNSGTLDGKLYAFGGSDYVSITHSNVYVYDGTNWTEVASLPKTNKLAAVGTLNNTLYSIGGNSGGNASICSNVYAFNGTDWTELPGMPTRRDKMGSALYNGRIYMAGGTLGGVTMTNMYAYDGTNFEQVAGLPLAMSVVQMETLNGYLYAFGGNGGLTNVYRYNGTNWTEDVGLPIPLTYMGSAVLEGQIYAIGGSDGTNTHSDVYSFDGTNWTAAPSLPVARAWLTASTLGNSIYAIGGGSGGGVQLATTNVYVYPAYEEVYGVCPSSGSLTGNYAVAVTGTNLGNGADITSVTICGASATINSQTTDRVWVTAGVAVSPGLGDVRVYSTSFGETVKSNAFTYNSPGMQVLGTNGAAIASGDAAQAANGTKFAPLLSGASWTNTFSITNNGTETLNISGFWNSNPSFEIAGIPASLEVGGVSNFTVKFSPTSVGTYNDWLTISNDSPTAAYLVRLYGPCFGVSTNAGPFGGGNSITIANGYFGNITNVLVNGVAATLVESSGSIFTIVLPAASHAGTVDILVQTSDEGDVTLANAYTYHPAGQICGMGWGWEKEEPLPAWMYSFGAFTLNGSVYAMGGGSGFHGAQNKTYRYYGTHWTTSTDMTVGQYAFASAVLGGYGYCMGGTASGVTNVMRFDGTNWTFAAAMPGARRDLPAATLGGAIYVFGGYGGGLSANTNVYRYDGTSWTQVTGLPEGRNAAFAATLGEYIYVMGGNDPSWTTTTNVWRFDGTNWTEVAGLPAARSYSATAVQDGYLYVMGGESSSAYRFDGTNWEVLANLPQSADRPCGASLDGAVYCMGGDADTGSNVYKYAWMATEDGGVESSSGSWTGGYEVVISGTNLCNGTLSDVTGVTLCGAPATVTGVSGSTQIVVTAGVAVSAGAGDVVVQSTSFGETVGTNAFTYNAPGMQVLGTNGATIVSGDDAQAANGTKFAPLLSGASWTSTFSITNNGTEMLTISGSGHVNPDFEITGIPASVPAGGTSQFTVKFSPTSVGTYNDWLTISNDSPTAAYVVRLYGPCFGVSTNAGPFGGGNAITIANGYFGDITNVLVDGVAATLVESSGSIFTIELPAASHAGTVDILVQTSDEGDVTLANAYTYHPAGQIGGEPDWSQWVEVAGLPTTRFDMGAGVLSNRIYGVGGANESAVGQTNVYCYDGTNWTEVPGLPAGRFQAVAGEVNGSLIVAGGSPDGSSPRTNAYRFTGTDWEEVAGLPNTFWDMAGATYAGAFYVIGGGYYGPKTNVYRFDGTNWTEVAGLPAPRDSMGATACGGYLYAVAGVDSTYGENYSTNVYRYDGTSWTEVAGLPAPRGSPGVAARDGALFVAGGQTEEDSGFGMPMPVQHTNVYRFDGAGWTEVAGLPRAWGNLLLANPDDALYAFGGSPMATNTYRYPVAAGASGVEPASGSWTGGYAVAISGTNLCDGTLGDVTGVTLCGVAAMVTGVSGGTQIVAMAGAAVAAGPGDVRVFSTSFGETVKSNGFEYLRAEQAALAFAPASPQAYGTTNALAVSGGSGTGAVSYAVTAGPGTIVGGTNLAVTAGTGDVVVVATKAQDDRYFATAATATVAAAKADQAIADFLPTNGSAFAATDAAGLSATASSGLAVAFAVGSGPGSISGGTNLTFTGAGEVAVVASQAGDANWNAAASATQTFIVAKAPQAALAFAPASPQTFGTTNALSSSGGSGTGAVGYSIAAGLGEIVGTNGLHALAGTGSVTVVATKASDEIYLATAATATVAYAKAAAQVFLLDLAQVYDGTARTISATTLPAGLTVEFTYDGNAWAPTNAGNYAATGTVNDADWQGSAAGTLAVARAQDAIVFGATNQTYDGTGKAVTAAADSGAAVTVTYDGAAALPVNAGTYAVTGVVDAANWQATNATTLTILKADQAITNFVPADGTQFVLGASTTLSAQAQSGFAVAFSNLTPEVASLVGTTIAFTSPGVARVQADQAGDTNWNSATPVVHEWRVGGLITNVAPAAANVGGGLEVTIQGIALGDGTDVAAVALCGVAATIVTQSANAVTVLAEAAPGTATGAVEVVSGTGGRMVLSNAFEYLWLDAPVQLAPTNVLLDQLTARWQAVSNATAYFLEAGLDEHFAAHVPGYEFLDAGAATNAPVDGLLDETPYWLRVFAWNDHGLSWASLVERVVTPAVNAADYDGDGQGELATFAATNAAWNFRSYRVDSRWDAQYGWAATVPVPADYDGDGRADLAVYHPAAGDWYIQPSAGGADRREHLGSAAAAPVPGDYDGDGRADLAVFDRTNGGRWSFRCSTDGDYDLSWGWSAVVPTPADYDGDGRTDVAVYHPASGNWYLVDLSRRRGAVVPQVVPWGWAAAVPVPADYDGDGLADIAVFHRPSATWYVRYSGGGCLVLAFGWSAVVPVPADYDGDGLADLAVYHAASGNWYVRQSSDLATVVKALGGPGQAPTGLYPQIHSWYRLP